MGKRESGTVLWMTGLSGSGKSTIARAVEERLLARERNVVILDGDNFRQTVSRDLGFSDADRSENNRRAAEVARILSDANILVIIAFISPFVADRERAREIVGRENFVEVFVDCPIEECERRDPKGLYTRARRGEIPRFTGLTSPFEAPVAADLHLRTHEISVGECVETLLARIEKRGSAISDRKSF